MFWLLLNYFWAVSRPVFLTGPRSVTTRENFWSSQDLTNASSIVQIYPFIHPANPTARSTTRAAPPPTPPTHQPTKRSVTDNQVTIYSKALWNDFHICLSPHIGPPFAWRRDLCVCEGKRESCIWNPCKWASAQLHTNVSYLKFWTLRSATGCVKHRTYSYLQPIMWLTRGFLCVCIGRFIASEVIMQCIINQSQIWAPLQPNGGLRLQWEPAVAHVVCT